MLQFQEIRAPLIIITVMISLNILLSISSTVIQVYFNILGFLSAGFNTSYNPVLTSCSSYTQIKYANVKFIFRINFVMVIIILLTSTFMVIGCIILICNVFFRKKTHNKKQSINLVNKATIYLTYCFVSISFISVIVYFGSFLSIFLNLKKCGQSQISFAILSILGAGMFTSTCIIWFWIIVCSNRIDNNLNNFQQSPCIQDIKGIKEIKEINQSSKVIEKKLQKQQNLIIKTQRLHEIEMTLMRNDKYSQKQQLLSKQIQEKIMKEDNAYMNYIEKQNYFSPIFKLEGGEPQQYKPKNVSINKLKPQQICPKHQQKLFQNNQQWKENPLFRFNGQGQNDEYQINQNIDKNIKITNTSHKRQYFHKKNTKLKSFIDIIRDKYRF